MFFLKFNFFFGFLSLAANNLNESAFLNAYPDIVEVKSAQMVFFDELNDEQIYKVTFTYPEIKCAPAPTPSGDACGSTGKLLETCEYVKVDSEVFDLTPTGLDCDVDLEEVIKPILKDEL